MTDPTLRNWRLIQSAQGSQGILVGEVTDHPRIPDGWMTTSTVSEMAPDQTWARTQSRLYRLAAPLPDDVPLPPGGKDAMLTRILHNAGVVGHTKLEQAVLLVNELAAPKISTASTSSNRDEHKRDPDRSRH